MTTLIAPPARAGDPLRERLAVPWRTVLPLAVVAAFGNGFWLIAMRGAIGAIERSRGAFQVWLLESTLLLPLYVCAVLVGLGLALRWFGPGPLRWRSSVATLFLVAVACSLASLLVQGVNAVHDYRLQATHVANMALHMPTCDAVCVSDRTEAARALQLHALALNGVVMLASTLVLLGLTVALRGGRLDLAATRRESGRTSRFSDVELLLVVALLGAAAIHASVVPGHLARWPLGGIALVLLTIAEVDAALLFALRPRVAQYLVAGLVSAVPALVWLCSLTVGLPFGPTAGRASAIGLTDTAATLLEVVTLTVALLALRSGRWRKGSRVDHPVRAAVAGVLAVTVAGVAVGVGVLGSERTTKLQQGDHGSHATAPLDPGGE